MIELAELWLPIVATGVLFTAATLVWPNHKILAVRLGFGGVACLLILALLQTESWAEHRYRNREAELPDRAWVSIDVAGNSGIKWDDRGARFAVAFILKNTGKTPAKNVFFEAKAVLPKMGQSALPTEEMRKYAEDIQRRRSGAEEAGAVLFPGEPQEHSMALLVERDEAVNLLAEAKMVDILPRVIACVSYSVEGSARYRNTCRSFYVITPNPKGPAGTFRGVALNRDYVASSVGISDASYSIAD